jgi:hypothetical protein
MNALSAHHLFFEWRISIETVKNLLERRNYKQLNLAINKNKHKLVLGQQIFTEKFENTPMLLVPEMITHFLGM